MRSCPSCNTCMFMENALIIGKGKSDAVIDTIDGREHERAIILDAESSLTLCVLNLSDAPEERRVRHRITLKQGSKLSLVSVTLHGNTTHVIESTCEGPNATSSITCVAYARGTEKQSITAQNMFLASEGGGEMLMKGVAEEKAHAILHGKIDIGLKGVGTNTYLTQDVLMLDASAKVDAIPGLEIKTNDVKASHSAGVRRITEEDYFMFAARGIEREEARHMFIMGFLSEAVQGLPIEQEVTEALEKKMKAE